MATGGALALAAGYAHADSNAEGAAVGSPGVISGNTVQLPVNVPLNVCGNTVNVVGLLNPASGNKCANKGGEDHHGGKGGASGQGNQHKDLPGTAHGNHQGSEGGASAEAATKGSPGVISGNGVQLPVDLPVNVSGNSVSLVGVLNPTFGNSSTNGEVERPVKPVTPPETAEPGEPVTPPEKDEPTAPRPAGEKPAPAPEPETAPEPQGHSAVLAMTGSGDGLVGVGVPAALGLMLGGGLLYRRFRRAPQG
ncbi:chaplin [Streptomyces pyxinae]|uniref:chaplin n=1 Tax=Streptomyces pyxinae TaxID=2970734 RepID=UPI002867FCAE|nr:chaplin family protein [Streptomyces sp. LP05-1]